MKSLTSPPATRFAPLRPTPGPTFISSGLRLWGANHFRLVARAGESRHPSSVRFLERLRPGEVTPGDLVLDPNHHRDRFSLNVGASPARLGVKPGGTRSGRK